MKHLKVVTVVEASRPKSMVIPRILTRTKATEFIRMHQFITMGHFIFSAVSGAKEALLRQFNDWMQSLIIGPMLVITMVSVSDVV